MDLTVGRDVQRIAYLLHLKVFGKYFLLEQLGYLILLGSDRLRLKQTIILKEASANYPLFKSNLTHASYLSSADHITDLARF